MPHNRGVVRLDTWLSQLLWVIARKQGGEIRISAVELEDVPNQCAVSTDYDPIGHEIVIRGLSGAAEMIVINTGEQWTRTRPAQVAEPLPSSQPSPANQNRSAVVDDDMMARIEQRLIRRAAERQREKETAEVARVQRDPSWP